MKVVLFVLGLSVVFLLTNCRDTDIGVGVSPSPTPSNIKGLPKQLRRVAPGINPVSYTFFYNDSTQQLIRVEYMQNNAKTLYTLTYTATGLLDKLESPLSTIQLFYQNGQLSRTEEIRRDSSFVGNYTYDPTGHLNSFRFVRRALTNTASQTTLFGYDYVWQGNNLHQLTQRGTQITYDEITIESNTIPNSTPFIRLFLMLTDRPNARWLSPNLLSAEIRLFEGTTLTYNAKFTEDTMLQVLQIRDETKAMIVAEESWLYY